MKKFLSALLAVVMVASVALTFVACNSNNVPAEGDGGTAEPVANEITIGSVTDLDANMMAGWTNPAQNAGIRTAIFGYSPIAWTIENEFVWDEQVVASHEATENEDGTKTYTIKINDDLKWNDGTGITAKDYVFSMLLSSSPEFRSTEGGDLTYNMYFVGYEGFYNGETKNFKGIRLIDDYTYSITIVAEELPFYFDMAYVDCTPLPIDTIAPGCDIADSEDGASITGEFTDAVLEKTISDPQTGYRYMPKKTCGPYQLESFDASTLSAVLTRNPEFKGLYDGAKPNIEKIILKKTVSATQMDELVAGQVDMLDAEGEGVNIEAGLKHVDDGKIVYQSYPRAGYGQVQFSCDFGPTQFTAVRQAITYCLDRNEFCRQFTSGHGIVVNGPYGLNQWEYEENKEALENDLNDYAYNLEKAKEVLIADGWTLNAEGNDFVEGTDDVRYKKLEDGTLMGCVIEWCATVDNSVADLLSSMLVPEAAKVGIKINQTTVEWGVLIANLYRDGIDTPTYHMFNLATGFVPVPSLWLEYSDEQKYMDDGWNTNFIADAELAGLAKDLKQTEPGDREAWSAKWLAFMDKWNELIPNIPLYSNMYHEFYNAKIENYTPGPLWQWPYAIMRASVKGAE